jgi:holin-like protein
MLNGFAALLAFQLLGELLVRCLRLPLSGPICGMALLVVWLVWRGDGRAPAPQPLADAAGAILPNMAILFVPVGVGVMAHWPLLSSDWLPLALALLGSGLLTVATTVLVFQWATIFTQRQTRPERPMDGRADAVAAAASGGTTSSLTSDPPLRPSVANGIRGAAHAQ